MTLQIRSPTDRHNTRSWKPTPDRAGQAREADDSHRVSQGQAAVRRGPERHRGTDPGAQSGCATTATSTDGLSQRLVTDCVGAGVHGASRVFCPRDCGFRDQNAWPRQGSWECCLCPTQQTTNPGRDVKDHEMKGRGSVRREKEQLQPNSCN